MQCFKIRAIFFSFFFLHSRTIYITCWGFFFPSVSLLQQGKTFSHILAKTDKRISEPRDISRALSIIIVHQTCRTEYTTTPLYTLSRITVTHASPLCTHLPLSLSPSVTFDQVPLLFFFLFVQLNIHPSFLSQGLDTCYLSQERVCLERAAVRCATSILHERLARARVYVQCIVGVFIILSGPSEDREPKQKRQRVPPSLPPHRRFSVLSIALRRICSSSLQL